MIQTIELPRDCAKYEHTTFEVLNPVTFVCGDRVVVTHGFVSDCESVGRTKLAVGSEGYARKKHNVKLLRVGSHRRVRYCNSSTRWRSTLDSLA